MFYENFHNFVLPSILSKYYYHSKVQRFYMSHCVFEMYPLHVSYQRLIKLSVHADLA